MMFCTSCRAQLADDAVLCVECGKEVPDSLRQQREPPRTEPAEELEECEAKSEGKAVALSTLFGLIGFLGIGQFYALHTARAFAFLFAGWAAATISVAVPMALPDSKTTVVGLDTYQVIVGAGCLLVYLVLWMWQAIDALFCVREPHTGQGPGEQQASDLPETMQSREGRTSSVTFEECLDRYRAPLG
jgi:hypothetical protein